jgi:hypothetical protein
MLLIYSASSLRSRQSSSLSEEAPWPIRAGLPIKSRVFICGRANTISRFSRLVLASSRIHLALHYHTHWYHVGLLAVLSKKNRSTAKPRATTPLLFSRRRGPHKWPAPSNALQQNGRSIHLLLLPTLTALLRILRFLPSSSSQLCRSIWTSRIQDQRR